LRSATIVEGKSRAPGARHGVVSFFERRCRHEPHGGGSPDPAAGATVNPGRRQAQGQADHGAGAVRGRARVLEEKNPNPDKLAPKFLELAEKNPRDPVAFESLSWILTHDRNTGGKDGPADRAVALLLRDHLESYKLTGLCQNVSYNYGKASLTLLRGVLDKSPDRNVQAEACLALAQRLRNAAQVVRLLKEQPERARGLGRLLGKEQVEELTKAGVARVEAESARYFKEFGEKYATRMKLERLVQVCRRGLAGSTGGETVLRVLLKKDERREVRGAACLALARSLKGRAGRLPEAQAADAEKLRKESEELFERTADKYADVKLHPRGATLGDQARGELFEMRFLVIGKEAPEVEGEDADGKKFKLSDYRGKVVLLDFWGNW
jgi:hypothetical protein